MVVSKLSLIGDKILRVAVPAPVHQLFDYLPPVDNSIVILPGMRIRVSFGQRHLVGLVIETAQTSQLKQGNLKPALELLDERPILDARTLKLLNWCGSYYHFPIGEVIASALPARIRQGHAATPQLPEVWSLTDNGRTVDVESLARAPRQREILSALQRTPHGLQEHSLRERFPDWRKSIRSLQAKGMVDCTTGLISVHGKNAVKPGIELNTAQQQAVDSISSSLGQYKPVLLHGVTGSGKTRVYLRIIEQILAQGKQALVLVPEIGLTSQLIARFSEQFDSHLAVLHSSVSDVDRHRAWHLASTGEAGIILGTRSAVFTPLKNPGLIIVDEEHDASLKQQDGFRYHARDIAVYRARQLKVPVILGSATPSLESLHNVYRNRYTCLQLPYRAAQASMPRLEVVDMRNSQTEDGFSHAVIRRIREHLDKDEQILIFLNRRGYAPVLLCHDCSWSADCDRCDAKMTIHLRKQLLRCHHCGAQRRMIITCPQCGGGKLSHTGLGTERVEEVLSRLFPNTPVLRIDRDTTRKTGELEKKLQAVTTGDHKILVGTQMLSKGHNFPNVTLAVLLAVDQGLHSVDFRGTEHLAQLILQVSGRAGRAQKPGTVLLQTYSPDHPLLRMLIKDGYSGFSQAALRERQQAGLPPFGYLALIRAEASTIELPLKFLGIAREKLQEKRIRGVDILGPAPAVMERRAGRYRAQLLVSSTNRNSLQSMLADAPYVLSQITDSRKVRWSLDIDPVSLD